MVIGGVKKIVAVDDSNVVLKMIKNVLDKEEYDLHPFTTGKRALAYLVQKDRIPDLIILDIEMPEMNGYEVLERIKQMDHLKNVPVIFLTANNEKKHVIKALSGGVNDYVLKPIDKDILTRKMNSLLRDQPADGTESGEQAESGGQAESRTQAEGSEQAESGGQAEGRTQAESAGQVKSRSEEVAEAEVDQEPSGYTQRVELSDGGWGIYEYNADGKMTKYTRYNADGSVRE